MKTLLKGGRVVSGAGVRPADVLLEGERIAAVGAEMTAPGAEAVDCTGKLLFPGFIDAHTHFDLEVCGTITADDFGTGSRAALAGGTTTVVDFAAPDKGESLHSGLRRWREKAEGRCACDYGFHMTVDDWNEGISREIGEMIDLGIPTFKLYMTYPAMMLPEGEMYRALARIKEAGGLAGVHCENSALIDILTADAKAAGRLSPASHPRTRPAALEAEAVGRLLRMAQVAGTPVVVVHLSSREGLEEVRAARRRGQRVYVETCPHYLLLEDGVYDAPDCLEAAKYVCAPPLRGRRPVLLVKGHKDPLPLRSLFFPHRLQRDHGYLIGRSLLLPVPYQLSIGPALEPPGQIHRIPHLQLSAGPGQGPPGDAGQVIRPAIAPVHRQQQVADLPSQGRPAQIGHLAQDPGKLQTVVTALLSRLQALGKEGDDQPGAHPRAVIKGTDLPRGPVMLTGNHRASSEELLRTHYVQRVHRPAQPLHLQGKYKISHSVVGVGGLCRPNCPSL